MSGDSNVKRSVIVVDDEPDTCSVIKKFIDGKSYRVSTFTNPSLALEYFKQEPEKYNILITDIRMPEMNGFELARNVKSISPQTKVVAMTAFEINPSEFEKVLPHTVIEAFMKKPISMQQLKEVLENLSTNIYTR